MRKRVAIVGGGLAGIAAAVRLAEADCAPILIETRKKLGGRATSFLDPRTGRVVDNCQHVLMGCCTNLIDLYDRLGVLDDIEWHDRTWWTRGGGEMAVLKPGWLPAPFHLAGALWRMPQLGRASKRAIARATWRIIRMGAAGRLAWRDRTFSAFLRDQGQPEEAVRDFWNAVVVSACNLDAERVSGEVALKVFQEGFLANRWSASMGVPRGPLAALYDPVAEHLERHHGAVRLGVSARALAFDGRRVSGVVTDEGLIEAAAVVAAVPFDRLDRLVSDTLRARDARLRRLDQFEVSPILGVHLTFGHRVMDVPHLVVMGRGVQWLFAKGVDVDGAQHIHAVISAAGEWMELDEAAIVARVVDDIHAVLPRSVGLPPLEARAVKEKRATFAALPGAQALRPPAEPSPLGASGQAVENLYLAGDWCDTGWPATMESAVRSGYLAARALCGTGGLAEDVPPGLLARWLGL